MSRLLLPDAIAAGIFDATLSENARTETKSRMTTMFELELPMESGGTSYIDGESMPISPHMLICARPGQTRHTRLPYKCYYIHIIVPEGALRDMLSSLPPFLPTGRRQLYEAIFQKLIPAYETGLASDELLVQSAILELIHLCLTEAKAHIDIKGHRVNDSVERAIEFIKEHLCEPLPLARVAAAVSLSPVHFHQTFRTATGKTLRSYIEELRLKRAINLLSSTDKTLTEIALECGFSSQSYFSFAFRRRMGETPREYIRTLSKRYYE